MNLTETPLYQSLNFLVPYINGTLTSQLAICVQLLKMEAHTPARHFVLIMQILIQNFFSFLTVSQTPWCHTESPHPDSRCLTSLWLYSVMHVQKIPLTPDVLSSHQNLDIFASVKDTGNFQCHLLFTFSSQLTFHTKEAIFSVTTSKNPVRKLRKGRKELI